MQESRKFKIRNLRLMLLYICLEEFRHPNEIMEMFGRERKSSYDRNISRYLNFLERKGLMISKLENDKKYFKTNEGKIAELIIEDKRAHLQKAKKIFKEEKEKIEKDNTMPKEVKEQLIKSLKPKIKIPTKTEAIKEFKELFEIRSNGNVYIKTGKVAPYSLIKIAELKK